MKLKQDCIFLNAKTKEAGGTSAWGQELGQGKGYLLKHEGCSDITNGLVYNIVEDISKFKHDQSIKNKIVMVSLFEKVKIKAFDFATRQYESKKIDAPFIIAIVKETVGSNIGRRTLKMNRGFAYDNYENEAFYKEIEKLIPNPCFVYEMDYDNQVTGILTLTFLKAPQSAPIKDDPTIAYETAKERKQIWDGLIETYKETNNEPQVETPCPINKIFYGAPGTGKSHKVKSLVNGKEARMERITFHPEFDYASFVGGYKPTMVEEEGKEVIKYKFVPQAFTNIYVKAWNDPNNDYYLVIEEINRGNCAEIFGDIFQLLDRDSDYDITPAIELEAYLEAALDEVDKGLKNGKLKLPKNLTIYATMNTSDQSLFPMDSAFKRRWDWEYIPICYEDVTEEGDPNPSFNYLVDLGDGKSFRWNKFISQVNLNHIQQNPVLGMDKCMGNYFVKPKKGEATIDVESFINKAIFYLWNDVFKDEKNEVFEEKSSYEDFFPIQSKGISKLTELLERIEVEIITNQEETETQEDEVAN